MSQSLFTQLPRSDVTLRPNDLLSNDHDAHESETDEQRPLLSPNTDSETDAESQSPANVVVPIPKGQMATLCAVRLVDPIAFSQIFPYVNDFVSFVHATDDPSRIGFYSGLVESTFAIAQLFTIYQWAKLSDRVGRRPVIFAGTIGIAIATSIFGLSQTFAAMLFTRASAGLFSGNLSVMHSMLGELTHPSNQARAFSLYGLCWPLGSIIGPLLGGTFADPAGQWPSVFGSAFWVEHPYFLPCFLSSMLSLTGVTLGLLYLDETHPNFKHKKEQSRRHHDSGYGSIFNSAEDKTELEPDLDSATSDAGGPVPPSIRQLLAVPVVNAICCCGTVLSFVASGFDALFVLFLFSPIASGGLARSIGMALAVAGTISALLQLLAMPALLRRYPIPRTFMCCMSLWSLVFLSLPLQSVLAQSLADPSSFTLSSRDNAILWLATGVTLILWRLACLSWSLTMLLVRMNAPEGALGATNGLSLLCQCVTRAIGPAAASSLFALSGALRERVGGNIGMLVGQLWLFIMVFCSLGGAHQARRVERLVESSGSADADRGPSRTNMDP